MKNTSRRRSLLRWTIIALVATMMMMPGLILNVGSVVAKATTSTAASGRVVIPGHMVPALNHHSPMHFSASNRQLQLSIALNLRNENELNTLLKEQNNPASPLYHQYLTPQEFTNFFGPTTDTVNQVVSYLRSQGLHVGSISSNHTLIDASGSVATVDKAFAVSIQDYSYNGRTVFAPAADPSVPSSLSGMILNISGLDDVAHYHPLTNATPKLGPNGGFAPSDLRAAYDMNPLLSSADGTGQTVAIFELDGYKASDVTTYLNQFGLGSAKFSNVLVDGATGSAGAGAIEVELDMEVVSAIAPGATQKIYIGPNSNSGVNDTYNRIVTDNIAKVTSTSWGECESDSGNSELTTLDNIFAQAAAQGQSIFAAAGDAGAFDCGTTTLAVDSPADDPNVVGVGGTNLQVGSGSTYSSESVWSNSSDTSRGPEGVGGGGGLSSFFAKPSYQSGPGVDSNTSRHVPDVSADADPATGYAVFCSVTAAGCPASNSWIVVGGTSAAAPLWAGVSVDTNEFLASQGKATLGNANATLYRLFNTTQTFAAYHDITTGNNLHYSATTGYDLASGIGSPDVWNFARDAANISGGGGTPTPTPTPSPTPSPTPPGGTVSQLLGNPGFEASTAAPWVETSSGGFEIVDNSNPHTGAQEAWLCGYNNCSDTITQSVTLPSTTTKVVLSYWLNITTRETSSTCFDHFFVRLLTSSGSTISTVQSKCNSSLGYTQFTFDVTSVLSSFAGQTIKVSFQATTDSSLVTNFFVDDTALNVTH